MPASPPDVTRAEKTLLPAFLFKKSEKAETPPEVRKRCFYNVICSLAAQAPKTTQTGLFIVELGGA